MLGDGAMRASSFGQWIERHITLAALQRHLGASAARSLAGLRAMSLLALKPQLSSRVSRCEVGREVCVIPRFSRFRVKPSVPFSGQLMCSCKARAPSPLSLVALVLKSPSATQTDADASRPRAVRRLSPCAHRRSPWHIDRMRRHSDGRASCLALSRRLMSPLPMLARLAAGSILRRVGRSCSPPSFCKMSFVDWLQGSAPPPPPYDEPET